jgi:hypothetical protein
MGLSEIKKKQASRLYRIIITTNWIFRRKSLALELLKKRITGKNGSIRMLIGKKVKVIAPRYLSYETLFLRRIISNLLLASRFCHTILYLLMNMAASSETNRILKMNKKVAIYIWPTGWVKF